MTRTSYAASNPTRRQAPGHPAPGNHAPGHHALNHHALVAAQFGATAEAYVASPVHAAGADLDQIESLVLKMPAASALDLGCGGGHVALRLAQWTRRVVAYDLSDDMLRAVAREAARLGRGNITCERGAVERLPFADASFDVIASRFSAHHWHDVPAALGEAHRVLTADGLAVFADVVTPERPLFDTWLQAMELIRDPSHARDLSVAGWRAGLAAAGFTVKDVTARRLRMDFPTWTARMGTPAAHAETLRALQRRMPAEAADYFELEADGSFTIDTMVMVATAEK